MNTSLIFGLFALIFSALVAFTLTPAVRVLAYKIGAIDVPRDGRRMHDHPIPRIGGLAIFAAFLLTTVLFCPISKSLVAMWLGGLLLVCTGILDDVFNLPPLAKLAMQIAAAVIAVSQGLSITFIELGGRYISLGVFSIPVTIIWIVGLTNAINLIDGLDGLSCGISAICSTALLFVILLQGDTESALITAVLTGSCLGFLPFNSNPAKIFMGDTGSQFLGYTLALVSIKGLFKFHTVVSFIVPLSIFALPLFDTGFAIIRRVLHGKSPFAADRGHIHHRLIDMGFNQKQSVYILYAICGILGISAVMFSGADAKRAIAVIVIGFGIFFLNIMLLKNKTARSHLGLDLADPKKTDSDKPAIENNPKPDLEDKSEN